MMRMNESEWLTTREGFERIYELYFDKAFRVALGVLKDRELAADAVQETFIRVYKYGKSYDKSRSFNAWFTGILMNECKRQMEKRQKVTYIADYEEVPVEASSWVEAWEEKKVVSSLLEQLDEKIKVPLLLKYVQGLKIAEIAQILSLNANTIKSRLAFGKEKMKCGYEKLQKEAK